jgi:hypothetical protein
LGCDIIDEYNITINTKRGIKVESTWIGCEVVRKSDKIARVFVKESVTVPANSEIIIKGTWKQAEYIDTATYTSHLTANFPIVKMASMTPCVFNLFPSSATTKHLLDS